MYTLKPVAIEFLSSQIITARALSREVSFYKFLRFSIPFCILYNQDFHLSSSS